MIKFFSPINLILFFLYICQISSQTIVPVVEYSMTQISPTGGDNMDEYNNLTLNDNPEQTIDQNGDHFSAYHF